MIRSDTLVSGIRKRESGCQVIRTSRGRQRICVIRSGSVKIGNIVFLRRIGIITVIGVSVEFITPVGYSCFSIHFRSPATLRIGREHPGRTLSVFILIFVRVISFAETQVSVVFDYHRTAFTFLGGNDNSSVLSS